MFVADLYPVLHACVCLRQFMNLVLDETEEEVSSSERNQIGMVVIRGNSVVQFECLDRI